MIVLSNRDIAQMLPMATAIEIVEKAMIAVSAGKANLPLRSIVDVGEPNRMGIMPGAMTDPACYGVKLVSLFPDNPAHGLSSHSGAMVLFEAEHGRPIAMMSADLLTAVRTAAASAVATRALSRQNAAILAVVGTGEQAEHHIEAMLAVRDLSEIRVIGRNAERAERLVARFAPRHRQVRFEAGTDIRQGIRDADIVCTVTAAATPILLGDWLAPGMHLNAVGSSVPAVREIDERAPARSALFVDYRPSALAQAGEITGTDGAATRAPHAHLFAARRQPLLRLSGRRRL
jgi:alanine dehydrogenase